MISGADPFHRSGDRRSTNLSTVSQAPGLQTYSSVQPWPLAEQRLQGDLDLHARDARPGGSDQIFTRRIVRFTSP
jgi:hypothetical protein